MHSRTSRARKAIFPALVFAFLLFVLASPYQSITGSGHRTQHAVNQRVPLSKATSHGEPSCLPPLTNEFVDAAVAWNTSCRKYSPFTPGRVRLATLSVSYGEQKPYIARALRTHLLHGLIHGDDMHVMCSPMVDGMWNKQAFLLSVLLEQMLLPPEERYEWIFWADRDSIILDYCRPKSSFLPPEHTNLHDTDDDSAKHNQIHLLATKDVNGLNAGVFFLRVHPWSIAFLENVLAYRFFNPGVHLPFSEQSAMSNVLESAEFSPHVVYAPWEWFNTYPNSDFGPEEYRKREDVEGLLHFQSRRGDFLMHFAGSWDKEEPMEAWLDVTENMGNVWEQKRVQRDISDDVKTFWKERGYYG